MDCSIRKSADQCLFATPRSLSQLTTSFFGSQCHGIRPAPFVACPCVIFGSPPLQLLIRICSLNYPTEKLSLMNHFLSLLVFLTSISQLFLCNFQCSLQPKLLVGTSGLEPPTSRLSGVRSNHLSYAPIFGQIGSSYIFIPLVEMRRIELLTPCVQVRCSPS